MERFFWIDLHYACFGIETKADVVTDCGMDEGPDLAGNKAISDKEGGEGCGGEIKNRPHYQRGRSIPKTDYFNPFPKDTGLGAKSIPKTKTPPGLCRTGLLCFP